MHAYGSYICSMEQHMNKIKIFGVFCYISKEYFKEKRKICQKNICKYVNMAKKFNCKLNGKNINYLLIS